MRRMGITVTRHNFKAMLSTAEQGGLRIPTDEYKALLKLRDAVRDAFDKFSVDSVIVKDWRIVAYGVGSNPMMVQIPDIIADAADENPGAKCGISMSQNPSDKIEIIVASMDDATAPPKACLHLSKAQALALYEALGPMVGR